MPYSKEQVYKVENFKFATLDVARIHPTLYFRTNHGSGRIRQSHPNGPLVQEIRMHYSHAFFHTKENAKRFEALLILKTTTRGEFRRLRKELGGHNRPVAGNYHVEGRFSEHEESGVLTVKHRSGGKVYEMMVTQDYVASALASAIKGQREFNKK